MIYTQGKRRKLTFSDNVVSSLDRRYSDTVVFQEYSNGIVSEMWLHVGGMAACRSGSHCNQEWLNVQDI